MRTHSRREPPKSLKDLLPQVVRAASKRQRELEQLRRAWARAVGAELSRLTRVSSLRRGTLYIQTSEPGANFVLNLEKPRLLAKLQRRRLGPIDDIVVRPGEVEAAPQ